MPFEFEKVQGNVVIVRASGKLTDDDYKSTFLPTMEDLFETWGGLRMLFIMSGDFEGWSLHGAWNEFMFELKHMRDMVKVAVVGDRRWEETATNLSRVFTRTRVHFFEPDAEVDAREWVTQGNF